MKSESRSTPKVSAVSFIHFLSWLVFLILCWVFSIFRASCTRVFNLSNIASSIDSSGILLSSRTHKHFKCELTVIMQQSPRPRLPRSAFTTRLSSGADMSMLNPFCIARAVRPFLWIYVSADRGIWKWTTWSTAVISRPRAAISVARRTEFGVCVNLEFREDDEWSHRHLNLIKKYYYISHTCQDSSAVDAVLTESAVGRHWYWAARQVAWVFGCRQSTIGRPAICQDI